IPCGQPLDTDNNDSSEGDNLVPINKENDKEKGEILENGITFASKKVPSHHTIQLTILWDNQVWEVKGYVWIQSPTRKGQKPIEIVKKHLVKDNNIESEEEEIKGLKHPNVLRLTYGDWVMAFNLMLDYLNSYITLAKQ
ncbi:hypothetical protein DFH28DRAFT_873512, partial [Melampsora americana]